MFEKVVQFSNHGTSSAIWPRFFLQLTEIAKLGVEKGEFDIRITNYRYSVLPEIERFYDTYHKLQEKIKSYYIGINSREYYSINDYGTIHHNKIPEREINNTTKDFFVNGKIMLVNFVKCGIINDEYFKLEDFYFCDYAKFENQKRNYLSKSSGIFLPLIILIEKYQQNCLKSFNGIRGEIEHTQFKIEDFKIQLVNQKIRVSEPLVDHRDLTKTLDFYYDNLLDFIEKLTIYFFGIKAENRNSFLQLYVRHNWSYPDLLYKYTVALGGDVLLGTQADRCLYD